MKTFPKINFLINFCSQKVKKIHIKRPGKFLTAAISLCEDRKTGKINSKLLRQKYEGNHRSIKFHFHIKLGPPKRFMQIRKK